MLETATGFAATKLLIHPGDVSDETYVKRLVDDTVSKFGALDVLVNNAGFAIFGSSNRPRPRIGAGSLATNLDALFFTTREALPHLRNTKECIINVSSVSGLGGDWGLSAYNAAKGGVTNYTRAFSLEFGGRGVRVNAVAPSLTTTEATVDLEKMEAVTADFITRLPLGRAATPAEVASVIAFLASDDARFVNGVIVSVDGGVFASKGQPNS